MKKQHEKACAQCPWRKESAAGWLGASTPMEFLQTSEAELVMPCHIHVNYERPDWEAQVLEVPQCAGRAIHFANRCKQPESKDLIKLKPDAGVFANPQDFINHHGGKNAPKIYIIGKTIIEQGAL